MQEDILLLKAFTTSLLDEKTAKDITTDYYVKEFQLPITYRSSEKTMYAAKLIETSTGKCVTWAFSAYSAKDAIYCLGMSAANKGIAPDISVFVNLDKDEMQVNNKIQNNDDIILPMRIKLMIEENIKRTFKFEFDNNRKYYKSKESISQIIDNIVDVYYNRCLYSVKAVMSGAMLIDFFNTFGDRIDSDPFSKNCEGKLIGHNAGDDKKAIYNVYTDGIYLLKNNDEFATKYEYLTR